MGSERTSEHVPASSRREVDAARILHRMCETFNTVHRANQFLSGKKRKKKGERGESEREREKESERE